MNIYYADDVPCCYVSWRQPGPVIYSIHPADAYAIIYPPAYACDAATERIPIMYLIDD